MRKTHFCPKCQFEKIAFIPRLTDYQSSTIAAHVSDASWERAGRLTVYGALEAYICLGCGYSELYAHEPDRIPLDQIDGARVLDRKQPYR